MSGGDTGRSVGDPVHEWVTEGRRKEYEAALRRGDLWAVKLSKTGGYSSCGDQAHCLLFCLGVRDESLVNRTGDGGDHPWSVGVNIARFAGSALLTHPHPGTSDRPKPGAIVWIATTDHVCIQEAWPDGDDGSSSSFDYGQPYGRRRVRKVAKKNGALTVDGRQVMGWLDLEDVVALMTESAIVPDAFEGGVLDDSPYPEQNAPFPAG
jgi:hypothetical protein